MNSAKIVLRRIGCIGAVLPFLFASTVAAQWDEEELLTWKPSQGIVFDGMAEYIEVPAHADFNVDQLTVEAWVYLRDNSGRQQIIGRGAAAEYFTFYADNGNGRMLVENIGEEHQSAIAPIPPANRWVHIAGTFDEQTVRLYYNGVEVAEQPHEAIMRHGDAPLMIGALVSGERHLIGELENIRFWNRALSAEELADRIATPPDEEDLDEMRSAGLVSYWSLRSMADSVAGDLVGGHDGHFQQFTNDETYLTFKPESGISFDGQSTYIVVEDGAAFNYPAFSMEAWVNFYSSRENQVFMNRGTAPTDVTFYLFDRVRFLVQDAINYNHANAYVPPAGDWIHIVGTIDEEGVKRLYYNGILQHENATPPNPITSNNPLYIGALEPGARHMHGEMENMRIWNKALSETEIRGLLSASPDEEDIEALKANGLVAYWTGRAIEDNAVIDITGNGHDGVFERMTVDETHLTFKPENGIPFDGVSSYAMLENGELFNIDFITVDVWVNLNPIFHDRTMGNRGVVGRDGLAQYFNLLGAWDFGARMQMRIADWGAASAPMPPVTQWIHICGVFDEDYSRLYYNGVLISEVEIFNILDWGEEPLMIGAITPTSGFFHGLMENIRVWDRALTGDEIRALLATAPDDENISAMVADGLLVYYSSREMGEDVLVDLTGGGNDAIYFAPDAPVSVRDWSVY